MHLLGPTAALLFATGLLGSPVSAVTTADRSADPAVQPLVQDGFQYVVLGMARSSSHERNQFTAPVTLQAELDGEVSGAPEYAAEIERPDEEPATNPARSPEQEGGATLPWVGGGVLGIVFLAGAVGFARRGHA